MEYSRVVKDEYCMAAWLAPLTTLEIIKPQYQGTIAPAGPEVINIIIPIT